MAEQNNNLTKGLLSLLFNRVLSLEILLDGAAKGC